MNFLNKILTVIFLFVGMNMFGQMEDKDAEIYRSIPDLDTAYNKYINSVRTYFIFKDEDTSVAGYDSLIRVYRIEMLDCYQNFLDVKKENQGLIDFLEAEYKRKLEIEIKKEEK